MKKVIVTTTINGPTKAIEQFQAMEDWHLVVIGDLKTPPDYHLDRGLYMTPDAQETYDKELSDAIGWNCIQRRNFGLLIAHDMDADIVAVVDDDNIPLDGWGVNLMLGTPVEVNWFETTLPVFDPIGATNYSHLWHRGYPLQLLPHRDYTRMSRKTIVADIQADFWNGDPDIDAVCRMEHAPQCTFDTACFPMATNTLSPFNSQNTFLSRNVLKDYFLYPGIGRMDDIWASYHVEANGFKVVYGKASVYQDRNVHDLVRDMKQEYLGYENNLAIAEKLKTDAKALQAYLPDRAVLAFDLYQRHFHNA
jgi:hypothetical protein